MFLRFFALFLSLLAVGSGVQAQTIPLEEDFEAGFPDTWETAGSSPGYWHVAEHLECGAVTRMAAYNSGHLLCAYPTYSFPTSGYISTPYIHFTANQPLEISFDYRLDIDSGDTVEVHVMPPESTVWTSYEIATTDDFVSDGALHSVTFVATGKRPVMGDHFSVVWFFTSDLIGNEGFGWMIDNVRIGAHPIGDPFCLGDGSGLACPCGNLGGAGEGCAHSGGHGAFLDCSGSASVAADDLILHAHQLVPGRSALCFQGTASLNGGLGVLFGDGLRCVGGQEIRFGVRTADAGGDAQWGPWLAAPGGWVAGQTRYFQVGYRDPHGSSCDNAFNLSHGTAVTFLP